jgi:hypothetical protein
VALTIPWLPGVETVSGGYWGHVEVMEHDAERARALIDDFYAGEPQEEPGLASSGNGEDHESDASDWDDAGEEEAAEDVDEDDGEEESQ